MRDKYDKKLDKLHDELIKMGTACEEAIGFAVTGLLDEDSVLREKAIAAEREIDRRQRGIEGFCMRLIMREQPVASDLRQIIAAIKIVTDMERIGDHAEDIAEVSKKLDGTNVQSDVNIADMTTAALKMLTGALDAFVTADLDKVNAVKEYDEVVNKYFEKIRGEIEEHIKRNVNDAAACLDLLMIAKYLERIGDHAKNIAEWVEFSITGELNGKKVMLTRRSKK